MPDLNRLALPLALALVARQALAVAPPEKTAPVISVANADDVHTVAKFEKGELTFLDISANPIEQVDEASVRPLREIAAGLRRSDHRVVSKDGRFAGWFKSDQKVYVVQEVANCKTVEIDVGESPGGAAFSPNGELLAIGFTYWQPKAEGVGYSEMRLFDVKGKLLRTLDKDGPGFIRPVFSPNGNILAVGNRNCETRLFEIATGKLLHTLPRKMSHELAFRPDGRVLAVAYVNGSVALWDVDSGEMLRLQPKDAAADVTIPFIPNRDLLTLDWAPRGDVLATGGWGGKIVLWDSNTLAKLKELEAPQCVVSVHFTSDGRYLLSRGYSGSPGGDIEVAIWAVAQE